MGGHQPIPSRCVRHPTPCSTDSFASLASPSPALLGSLVSLMMSVLPANADRALRLYCYRRPQVL
jgi:hypothetical protein